MRQSNQFVKNVVIIPYNKCDIFFFEKSITMQYGYDIYHITHIAMISYQTISVIYRSQPTQKKKKKTIFE